MRNLLVEGWRGVNHSFAIVNQCQMLELLGRPGLRLLHRDLPYAMPHWNAQALDAGFAPEDSARIAALPASAAGDRVDCVYRIVSPFRADAELGVPLVTFMVTELGLSDRSFAPGAAASDVYTRDRNIIVTPSRWSRDRLLDHGFAPERVHVVAHGVRADTYRPPARDERAAQRERLGLRPDETVFLNLGAAMWNKGLDVLLRGFARLVATAPAARPRLILKDQRGLYGVSSEAMVRELATAEPALFNAAVLGAITVVPGNLSQAQLRAMYAVADCYVSPYRAEGFNLPVLEAIACGTPAIVTAGGATDDFCDAAVALRVASRPGSVAAPDGRPCRYREPDADALLAALKRVAAGDAFDPRSFEVARSRLVQRMTWRRAADALQALVAGCVADRLPLAA